MTFWRVFLTALFFLVVSSTYSVGEESPLSKDVKFDNVHANPKDYKDLNKKSPPKKTTETMLATCIPSKCTK